MHLTNTAMASYCAIIRIGQQISKKHRLVDSVWQRIKALDIVKPIRGSRAGINLQRPIEACIFSSSSLDTRSWHISDLNSINVNNLVHVKCDSFDSIQPVVSAHGPVTLNRNGCNSVNLYRVSFDNRPKLKAAIINAQSVCNKASTLCEFVKKEGLDVCGITETWLTPADEPVIAELTPPGYSLQHIPRLSRGGGVAILHRDSVQVLASPSSHSYESFEFIERKIVSRSSSFLFVVVYRLSRKRKGNKKATTVPVLLFIKEFRTYLETVLTSNGKLILC